MIRMKPNFIQLFAVLLILGVALTGCATKKYVIKRVTPVDQKVDALAAQTDQKFVATNEKVAAVASTQQRDISQVNERISTNEAKLGLASTAAQQAQATASSAMSTASTALSEAQANQAKLAADSQAVAALGAGMANALNYKLIEKADVTFGFNRSSLTPEAKAALDQLAIKVQSMPRVVVEVVGFADAVGPQDYNIDLSRKRADTVERYLVTQRVPLHVIHTVGLGEEVPPSGLEADNSLNTSKSEGERAGRRVLIRIFGAPDVVQPQVTAGVGGQK
jgi:outer membrane protein OmpA-like peptidoglycan-associated protein